MADVVGVGADAAGHPDPWALKDAGYQVIAQYLGTPYQHYGVSREYIDQCFAAGIGVILIMEEWSSQFLGGYPAAVQSCARMMAAWDALGAPRDGSVIPHVVLVDPTPSAVYGAEGVLQAYAKGWDDVLPFPAWRGYGSKYGMDLAVAVTTKMLKPWGVGTWGYGESGNGSLPAWTGEVADMIQHGNVGGWVPGIDHNSLFRIDLGAWGGPAPATPVEEEHEDMAYIAVGNHPFLGRCAAIVDGGYRNGEFFTGELGPPEYGSIPKTALDWNAQGGRGLKWVLYDDDQDRFLHALEERPTGEAATGDPDKPITAFTDAELKTEVDARVARGEMTLTGSLQDQ